MRLLRGSAVFVLSFAIASATLAQARTFVASTGSDANPCTRTAPCRNFNTAVAAVTDGGEVVALDSAGYGTVSITKSVSIIAPAGVYAGITAFSGDAIHIDAATSNVYLRGLTLNSAGATSGITSANVAVLRVDGCTISGFTVSPSSYAISVAGSGRVFVHDVDIHDNRNGFGIVSSVVSGVMAEIDDSRIDNQGNDAIYVQQGSTLNVKRCRITGNPNAFVLFLGAIVSVSQCQIADTGTVYYNSNSTIYTYANNEVITYGLYVNGTNPATVPLS